MIGKELLREIRLPRAADCRNELRVALGVAVVGVARLRVEVCLFNDGFVSGKIGVADGKVDDIVVFCQCLGVEREPGARVLDASSIKMSVPPGFKPDSTLSIVLVPW